MTGFELWQQLFDEYNATYWHDTGQIEGHKCPGSTFADRKLCPDRPPGYTHTEAYAELGEDIPAMMDSGRIISQALSKGTTVRVTMVSRFGDLGIHTRLDTLHGYEHRIAPEKLINCRRKL